MCPICSTCISSDKHHGHKTTDIVQKLSSKTKDLKRNLKELETNIYVTYKEIALDIKAEKASFEKHFERLTTADTKQGKDWRKEINIIVKKQKSEIDEMKTKLLVALDEHEKKIKKEISEINQSILDLRKILDSSDISLNFAYKSRNAEFRSLPPKIKVSFPVFYPRQINTVQLNQMFGSLSEFSISTDEHGNIMKTPIKSLLDEPELITTIDTGLRLLSISCLSDEEIWTRGKDNMMRLYNLQGELLKSIKTRSENTPRDIALTRCGDLVYTDLDERTVNIVKNDQTQEVIRLKRWIPFNVCSTSCGDLLVTMDSDDKEQSKVVRYSGSTQKQTIQFDRKGKPLYSSDSFKYMTENKNLDICVSDDGAKALVVVNEAGELRFKYTGHLSSTKESFHPSGITTDSQSQILISDATYQCIHILDYDGHFFRYIDNCDLNVPNCLCVDTRDNLFVVDWGSGNLKKIKYMQTICQ
ncbi:uncharacterized protein LOC133186381 [Saccostrea echinata]|uniref:uncharacterized protein LOC133186381 n=1 Tax=Saccostrea echinata TaxID=191078 RepID=UPI002A81FCF7|nr:uncharacterized protein LOC133186381 [Saccostrea echinata]